MSEQNSSEWENKFDFRYKDYARLENYLNSFNNAFDAILVNQSLIENEHMAEEGSFIGGGGRATELIRESRVYHVNDSTVLIERMATNLTKIKIFSPNKNRAQKLLEEILKQIDIK